MNKGPKSKTNPMIVEGVTFIQFTPGNKLKKELQEKYEKKTSGKVSGKTSHRKTMQNNGGNPGISLPQNNHCGCPECKPCITMPGKYKLKNMVYQIIYQEFAKDNKFCPYVWESHRSFFDRSQV